jgi:hypothetical protein
MARSFRSATRIENKWRDDMKTILSTAIALAFLGGAANAGYRPFSDQQALPRASGYEQALPRWSDDEFKDAVPRASDDDFRQALPLTGSAFPDILIATP